MCQLLRNKRISNTHFIQQFLIIVCNSVYKITSNSILQYIIPTTVYSFACFINANEWGNFPIKKCRNLTSN